MSIAIFLPTLWIGGAEKLHANLINEWIQSGYDVELIILFKSNHDIDIGPLIDGRCKQTFLELQNYKQSLGGLIKVLKKKRYDFILAPMWPLTCVAVLAWLLTKRHGKLFLSEHTNLSASHKSEIKTPFLFIRISIFFLYRLAHGIIAVSQGVKDDISELGRISKKQIEVIYNPVATGIQKPSSAIIADYTNTLWNKDFQYKFLAVGSLKEQKNFKMLISAFSMLQPKILNQSQLIILGDGPLKNDLMDQIEDLKMSNQISLPGRVLNPYPWFHSADLFVLSSSWEGFGNVLVEALECSLPIVSTDCQSGPCEILKSGRYGVLVPVNNHFAFRDAMQETLFKSKDKDQLWRRAQDFSVKRISDKYLEFFQNA